MSLATKAITLATVSLLVACTGRVEWAKPEATPAEVVKNLDECFAAAGVLSPFVVRPRHPDIRAALVARDFGGRRFGHTVSVCMRERGYDLVPAEDDSAAIAPQS